MTACILTTKDFTILEVMLERSLDEGAPLARLLRAKTSAARVVFREDIPATIATLNSRVTFAINGAPPDTRIISQASMSAPTGHFQPLTTLRGLALLGMMQGQTVVIEGHDGNEEQIDLLRVDHQPEAAQREMRAASHPRHPAPILTLVSGGKPTHDRAHAPAFAGFDDDPGPSAA